MLSLSCDYTEMSIGVEVIDIRQTSLRIAPQHTFLIVLHNSTQIKDLLQAY
jgi:hypothetical protein